MACSLLVNIQRRSITRNSAAMELLWKKDITCGDESTGQPAPASEYTKKHKAFLSQE